MRDGAWNGWDRLCCLSKTAQFVPPLVFLIGEMLLSKMVYEGLGGWARTTRGLNVQQRLWRKEGKALALDPSSHPTNTSSVV